MGQKVAAPSEYVPGWQLNKGKAREPSSATRYRAVLCQSPDVLCTRVLGVNVASELASFTLQKEATTLAEVGVIATVVDVSHQAALSSAQHALASRPTPPDRFWSVRLRSCSSPRVYSCTRFVRLHPDIDRQYKLLAGGHGR